ncbi:MAG TPA: ABC transporter ATP-binding protein [Candidatus Sulfotelmatobacter sp.]|nr:ABC transporter ATP-binding protein [Candidatus Sulfotelmatobacter sp.]
MVRQKGRRERVARPEEPSGSGSAIIKTRQLTKHYGTLVAVDHLDLVIQPGEVFGLLGPNGAGKTTTILMLLGLSEPTSGRAQVVGFDPTREPLEVKSRVGYLPDDVGFYGELTGRQNLRYTAALNGLERRAGDARIDGLLEQVGLADSADRPVEQYSRGMRQRLGLADALVKDPSVIILDEPTASIDPAGVAEVLDLIRSLSRDQGVTVLLSSHLLHQVHQICDRVAIFSAGRILAQGPMAKLAEQLAGGGVELEVGVDGPADQVAAALHAVPGVRTATRDPREPGLWRVTGAQSIRTRLSGDLAGRGMSVWQLRRIGDDLDEIYMRYFAKDEAEHGRAA